MQEALIELETTPPSTDIEKDLISLWESVLPHSKSGFGVTHDFFQLGGDSLIAVNLVSKAREAGILIDYDMLRKAPTVRQISLVARTRESLGEEFSPDITPFSLIKDDVALSELRQQAVHECDIKDDLIEDIFPATEVMDTFIKVKGRKKMWESALIFPISEGVDIEKLQLAWKQKMNDRSLFRTRCFVAKSGCHIRSYSNPRTFGLKSYQMSTPP